MCNFHVVLFILELRIFRVSSGDERYATWKNNLSMNLNFLIKKKRDTCIEIAILCKMG